MTIQNGKAITFVPDAELRRIQSFEHSVDENGRLNSNGRIYCAIGETKTKESLCIKYDDGKFEKEVWVPRDYPGIDFDGLLKDALEEKIGHKEIADVVKNTLADIAAGKCPDKGVVVAKDDGKGGTVYCDPDAENVTYVSANFGKGTSGEHEISQIPRAEIIKGLIEDPEKMLEKLAETVLRNKQKTNGLAMKVTKISKDEIYARDGEREYSIKKYGGNLYSFEEKTADYGRTLYMKSNPHSKEL